MATTAVRSSSFISKIGVTTHLAAINTNYWDQGTVIADLKYLGISHVRDNTLNSAGSGQGSYGLLAAAGVKFDFIFEPPPGLNVSIPLLDAFASAHPGAISSIEGPNEVNLTPTAYDSLTGATAAVSFQSALFSDVNADAKLAYIPVLNFTDVGATVAGRADHANVHVYPTNGAQPYAPLAAYMALQKSAMPGKPVALTEVGYSSAHYNADAAGPGGVDLLTQAKLTLNAVMDATQLGFSQIDLYQLLDGATDASGTDPQAHNGLFNNSGAPKLAAAAVHNLLSVLADTGANAATFTPGALNYTISGMPATGHSYLIQKSSGVYDLVLWNEPRVWNAATDTEVHSTPPKVVVNLGATFGSVDLYDTMSGAKAVYDQHNVNHVGVTLVDHPLILQISTASTAAPIVNTPYSVSGSHIMFNSGGVSYYVVTHSTDVINAPVGGATQTVQASCSYVLPANLTNLTLIGSANLTAIGNNLDNSIFANSGNDTLIGGAGADHLFAGAGADTLVGGAGSTIFMPGSGVATMIGGSGSNTFNINNTADVVRAQAGAVNNTIDSSVSFTAPANVGALYLTGTANLTATANNGTVALFANSGNDTLIGGAGADHLFGGAGSDTLIAGTGVTMLAGGAGADRFVFKSVADTGTVSHPNIISDFVSGKDAIDLSAIAHAALGAGHSLSFIGTSGFTHVAGQVDYATSSNGLHLQGDLNGDGVADFSLLLTHTTSIAAHDLVLG